MKVLATIARWKGEPLLRVTVPRAYPERLLFLHHKAGCQAAPGNGRGASQCLDAFLINSKQVHPRVNPRGGHSREPLVAARADWDATLICGASVPTGESCSPPIARELRAASWEPAKASAPPQAVGS